MTEDYKWIIELARKSKESFTLINAISYNSFLFKRKK
jgi:hypothetical protein